MLTLNFQPILTARGIDNAYKFLRKAGFTHGIAYSLINYDNASIRFTNLNKLCELLKCTPNDILEWRPDKDVSYPEDNPLKALAHNEDFNELNGMLRNLPLKKLKEINKQLLSGKQEGGQINE